MTQIKLIPILPKKDLFNAKTYQRAIENAGSETAKAIEVDYHVTTRTWQHKPEFGIKHTGGSYVWIISTKNKIYGYVSEGTRPHVIKAKNVRFLRFYRTGFRPKSRAGWIGSNKGQAGNKDQTFTRLVRHPGTKARNFAQAIKKKWDKEWPRQLDRAIRAAVRYG